MIFSFWKRRLLAKQTAELLSIATAQVRESITKWVPVDRVVGCKHCGQRMLAWPRSAAAKWYLVHARESAVGAFEADWCVFHNCGPLAIRGEAGYR